MDQAPPTPDQRRRAVCDAMTAAPGLIRYATRFTRSLADAEDAYQRAMEIALTRAPTAEPARFMAWLRVVLRNEALAVSGVRRREGPMAGTDAADAAGLVPDDRQPAELRAQWRERYLIVQDALGRLSEAQRICVLLQASGASYEAIERFTGFSRRKVERSVLEGRAALGRLELAIGEGEGCAALADAIDRVAAGIADGGERRRVRRHLRHCRTCRATLRDRHDRDDRLAALVPVALVLAAGGHAAPPDPAPALAWFERIGTGATFRLGQVVQVAMDAPGSVAAKVGTGAAIAAVAGTAGVPMLTGGHSPAAPVVRVPLAATARALAIAATPAQAAAAPAEPAPVPPEALTARIRRADLERVARLGALVARRRAAPAGGVAVRAATSTRATTPARAAAAPAARPAATADLAGARGIGVGPGP
ncbi:MAG: sigma-70 family RNA polymerase sigma factor [Thermoleophilia bacterium]|nr:sigma-70 family RNA polymerase sigma factor [Thermoleophilia bacterium]